MNENGHNTANRQDSIFCPNCGKALKPGEMFCVECGTPRPSGGGNRCRNCGTEICDGQDFCPNCGTRTGTGSVSVPSSKSAVSQSKPPAPKKKKKALKIVLIILLAIIVIFAGLVIIAFVSDTSGDSQDSNSSSEVIDEDLWVESYYVDEFGDQTDERCITLNKSIEGVFSNSATTDSELAVNMAIDDDVVGIFLYEYGDNQVKNYSSNYNENYTLSIRSENGREATLHGAIGPSGDRIILQDSDMSEFIEFLSGSDDFKVSIVQDDYTVTQYLFKVSPGNFADIY